MVREFAIRHFCGGFLDEKLTGLLNGDRAKGRREGGGLLDVLEVCDNESGVLRKE